MRNRLLPTLLVVAGLALLVWALPWIAQRLSEAPAEVVEREEVDPAEVDAFLDAALERAGADDVLAREERDGVRRMVLRLSPGVDAVEVGERIARSARDVGFEAYAMSTDGLDSELRTYAGPELRAQVLLMPDLSAEQRAPRAATLRERPLVSIIITDLGDADLSKVMELPLALSVAIRPWRPFSLRLAHEALRRHKEILVHLPEGDDAHDALDAVPRASGMVLDGPPGPELPPLPFGVVVYAASQPGRRLPDGLTGIAAQSPGRLGPDEALARTRALATRHGAATLVVEADDPGLETILTWSARAHLDGFRLALASEVARTADVQGQPGGR